MKRTSFPIGVVWMLKKPDGKFHPGIYVDAVCAQAAACEKSLCQCSPVKVKIVEVKPARSVRR